MIFKRPKTLNNFGFYYDPIGGDNYDDKNSKEEEFDVIWDSIFEDPLYFWYLMQIIEGFKEDQDEYLNLSDFGEVADYENVSNNYDNNIWNENSLWDILPYQEPYCLVLYRISYLTRVFFAFDIKRLFISGYPDEIAKDFLKSYFSKGDDNKSNDDDCEYISFSLRTMKNGLIPFVKKSYKNNETTRLGRREKVQFR